MMGRLEQGLGILLVLIILLDIFLTVLYARIGTSIIGSGVGRLTRTSFVKASKVSGSRQGAVLSFCGPVILVLLVGIWALGLTLGAALIMHPELGTSIRATNGETPTDLVTAIYAGGTSMAIVGARDFTPHTSPTRLLFLFNSLIGMSVMSLTLTYLMQVYTALQRRNVLAMNIHFLSGCTGDAAELLARLGPQGQFSGGYTNLSELGVEMTMAKESHHFYPVLFYFRFSDPYHSVSRSTLVALDTVSLIKSALYRSPSICTAWLSIGRHPDASTTSRVSSVSRKICSRPLDTDVAAISNRTGGLARSASKSTSAERSASKGFRFNGLS